MNIQSKPTLPPEHLSIDAFFAWAEGQERKYELVDGIAQLQAWVKRNHNRIAVNIVSALDRQLDGPSFEIAAGDFAVSTGPRTVRYADVMVEPAGGPGGGQTAEQAILLVEILSESTMHIDFGKKLSEYQALPSLDTYLVVAQAKRHAWQGTRDVEGNWPANPLQFEEAESAIDIEKLGVTLRFSDVYRNVN